MGNAPTRNPRHKNHQLRKALPKISPFFRRKPNDGFSTTLPNTDKPRWFQLRRVETPPNQSFHNMTQPIGEIKKWRNPTIAYVPKPYQPLPPLPLRTSPLPPVATSELQPPASTLASPTLRSPLYRKKLWAAKSRSLNNLDSFITERQVAGFEIDTELPPDVQHDPSFQQLPVDEQIAITRSPVISPSQLSPSVRPPRQRIWYTQLQRQRKYQQPTLQKEQSPPVSQPPVYEAFRSSPQRQRLCAEESRSLNNLDSFTTKRQVKGFESDSELPPVVQHNPSLQQLLVDQQIAIRRTLCPSPSSLLPSATVSEPPQQAPSLVSQSSLKREKLCAAP
ncbi:unnamed protein product, partial [Didymodactylos carnosus]